MCFWIQTFYSLHLLTCLSCLNKHYDNAESNAPLRRPSMQRRNETRVPKWPVYRLSMSPKTEHTQFQIRHSPQKMGKNHNQNQTNNRLQEISLRNLVRQRRHYRLTLILEYPKAFPRIEAHTLERNNFWLNSSLNKFQVSGRI